MSPNKTPLQIVNEEHGGKEKLVQKILGAIETVEEEGEEIKDRLLTASNKKLLRLMRNAESLKAKFGGSKDKLVSTVAGALGRAKDNDYVRRLSEYTPGRLLDMAGALARRAGGKLEASAGPVIKAAKAAAKPKAAKPKAEKKPTKAAAKKPAAKKPAAKGKKK